MLNANRLLLRFYQQLQHYPATLGQRELALVLHLGRSQLQQLLAGQGATAISFEQYYRLLQASTEALGDTDFFLRLGYSYDITDLGVLAYAMLSAENLRKSWQLSLHADSALHHPLQVETVLEQNRVIIGLSGIEHLPGRRRALTEEWLFGTWKWLLQRLPALASAGDAQMTLAYSAPEYAHSYRQLFAGQIQFDADVSSLSFAAHWYEQPFNSFDAGVAELSRRQYQKIRRQLPSANDLVEQVRERLLLKPREGFPSLAQMAAEFSLPSHSFHRRLQKVGRSYRSLVNEVRMELAADYICNTHLPLQEISYLLGYQQPPSFYRSVKKHFAQTPQQLRGQK
ncbi:MAG: AraC family transcriptional regulator [Cellvibrionaceae bacterium]|nr:AraC family transcriptional regulator [Cellvibrionaceae bacterium]MCV6625630.1 AraC family transcriptional regulator [Cellvibrionaceae bacterium]